MQKSFRDSLDMPVKPGDVVLVRGRRRKSRVLVMEVFYYDVDDRHLPVLRVLESYTVSYCFLNGVCCSCVYD